jgi:hypothetical protein
MPDLMRVFISSKMAELAEERQVIQDALAEMFIEALVYADEAGSRSQSIQQTYSQELADSDIYLGIFWKGYGTYTIEDEFALATRLGKPRLMYEKRTELEERDPRLQAFLDSLSGVESGLTIQRYHAPQELRGYVKRDMARLPEGVEPEA